MIKKSKKVEAEKKLSQKDENILKELLKLSLGSNLYIFGCMSKVSIVLFSGTVHRKFTSVTRRPGLESSY